MRHHRLHSTFTAAIVAVAALSACADSPALPSPEPQLPPLTMGPWYLNVADGQPLPALVAHRLVDGQLEQTFVDSSLLVVHNNGTWEQSTFRSRAVFGRPAENHPVIHGGTWSATDSGYLFRAPLAGRDFVIRAPGTDSMRVVQRLADFAQAGLVVGDFRRTRPARSLVSAWRAQSAKGTALPALVETFQHDAPNERHYSWHVTVDSVELVLTSQRTYVHHVHITEWEGDPFGPPLRRMASTRRSDYGEWAIANGQLVLESRIYQLTLIGVMTADGALVIEHGLGPHEDRFTVRFIRGE